MRNENLIGEWTAGVGYTVSGNSIVWSSVSDTTAETYQVISVPKNTFLELSLDFSATLTDTTIVTDAVSATGLDNANIKLTDNDTSVALSTIIVGQSASTVKRGCIMYTNNTTNLKVAIIGRRAGTATFSNISVKKLMLPRSGQRKSPVLGLESFKGGNYGELRTFLGSDIPATWLNATNFTETNRNAWIGDFNDSYIAYGVKICRIFLNIAGDYTNLNLFNADWSGLNEIESTNLCTFFNDIPDGIKMRVVLSRHTGIPESVFNTTLEPTQAHETQANFLARVSDVMDLLVPYLSKISSVELINEPNLNIGGNVSWGNLQDLLKKGYDIIKPKIGTIPVAVSHQSQKVYMYPDLILTGTADMYDFHWYADQAWKTTQSNTFLHCLPEYMDKPLIMGEWGANEYSVLSNNQNILDVTYNLYYKLGFEHVACWSLGSNVGRGVNMPLIAQTYVTPDGQE